MKLFKILVLMVCISGCDMSGSIRCEAPYYSGPVNQVSIDRDGTTFRLPSGEVVRYAPGIKCEVTYK